MRQDGGGVTRAAVDRGGAAEDGRLTDSQGRTVDFKNTVIIMTSNIAGEVEEGSDLTFTARNDELAPVQQAHAAKQ